MQSAFPTSDYYGGSAPPATISRRWTCRHPTWRAGTVAITSGSHVHCHPFDGIGAQLFPGGLATANPQHFTVASGPANP